MRRLLLLVSGVVLSESIFFTALAPLLPHYTRTLGLSKAQAGVLVCSYAAGSFAAALPAGLATARYGAKTTAIAGLTVLSVLSVVFGFAEQAWLLDSARFGQGTGASLAWTGALTWLVSGTPAERRGHAVGIATAAAAGGALLGPAVGAAASLVGPRAAFTGIAFITAIFIAGCARAEPPGRQEEPFRNLLSAIRHRPGIATGVWLIALPSLGLGVIDVLVPLRLAHLGASPGGIAAVFLIAAALQASASVIVGRWSDLRGRRSPLVVALTLSTLFVAALPFASAQLSLFVLLTIAVTASFGVFFAPAIALLTDDIDAAGLGQALGLAILNLAWSPGQALGSAGGGAAAAALGDTVPFLIVAAAATITLLSLLLR